jgi:hypothetical protein
MQKNTLAEKIFMNQAFSAGIATLLSRAAESCAEEKLSIFDIKAKRNGWQSSAQAQPSDSYGRLLCPNGIWW